MQKIIPHLWFDKEASEAAHWYVSLFEGSKLLGVNTIEGTPSGDAELVEFKLANLTIAAISAGPYFTFNPSASFMVSCGTIEEVDRLYNSLCSTELMPLGEYPFSKRYAWVQDRYGLGWQLMLADNVNPEHKIRPSLLFSAEDCGKAEVALDFYASIFKDSKKGHVSRYAPGEAADPRAKINYAELQIGGLQLIAMDDGFGGDFAFNEAFSLMVLCQNQGEIDEYWDKLSFVPEAEQCGWLKDRFNLSWQITPAQMNEVMLSGTKEEIQRMTKAFLQMKKFDLAELEWARLGE